MAVPAEPTNWEDPCAVLAWLRPAYYRMLAGGSEVEVRFGEEWVKYGQGNSSECASLILRLEGECAKKQGRAPRRFAARLGAYRGW